ncbi:unnamed protein product [Umbelopsis sp. WA50703]
MQEWTASAKLVGHKRSVVCLDYAKKSFIAPDLLASGSEDQTCRIWDIRTCKAVKAFAKQGSAVNSVKFATKTGVPNFYMAVGSKVLVFDLRNTDMILSEPSHTYQESGDEINTIDVNEKNNFLCTADDLGEVKVIDLESHKLYKQFRSKHKNLCMEARFRPRKPWELWSGGMDTAIMQWDISRGSVSSVYDTNNTDPNAQQMVNPPFVYALRFHPNGEWVASGLGDGSVHLLKMSSKSKKVEEKRLSDSHGTIVNSLAFEDQSKQPLLWSGSANGTLAKWDLNDPVAPLQQYKIDMAKLNWIETFVDPGSQSTMLAAAGITSTNEGAIHLYKPF